MRLYDYLIDELNKDEDVAVSFNEYLKEILDLWGEQYCENLIEDEEISKVGVKREFLSFIGKGNVEEFFEIGYEDKAPQVIKEITENETEEFIKKALGVYEDLLDNFIDEVVYNANKTIAEIKALYANRYYTEDEEYEDEDHEEEDYVDFEDEDDEK